MFSLIKFAGAHRLERRLTVLETAILPLNDAPLPAERQATRSRRRLTGETCFFVRRPLLAELAKLLILKFAFDLFLVFGRVVVRVFADATFQSQQIILRHCL